MFRFLKRRRHRISIADAIVRHHTPNPPEQHRRVVAQARKDLTALMDGPEHHGEGTVADNDDDSIGIPVIPGIESLKPAHAKTWPRQRLPTVAESPGPMPITMHTEEARDDLRSLRVEIADLRAGLNALLRALDAIADRIGKIQT